MVLQKHRLSFSSGKPYFEKIHFQNKPISCEAEPQAVSIENAISLQNVSFQYGTSPVLDNISMSFEKGKKVCIGWSIWLWKVHVVEALVRVVA